MKNGKYIYIYIFFFFLSPAISLNVLVCLAANVYLLTYSTHAYAGKR